MLDALIAGERDPKALVEMARGRMKAKNTALKEALTGRFDTHHAELATMLLRQIDTLGDRHRPAHRPHRRARRRHPSGGTARRSRHRRIGPAGSLPVLERLDEIPGIGIRAAQVIVAEIGLDMGPVPDSRPPRVVGQGCGAHHPVKASDITSTPVGVALRRSGWSWS